LGISWLVLTSAIWARPPKLVSNPQIRLLRVHHRVVVALRVLQLDREAVRDHLVARVPLGQRYVVEVQALPRVLVPGGQPSNMPASSLRTVTA
jgi:hypothetical protein